MGAETANLESRVVRVRGEIDMSNVGDLKAEIDAALSDSPHGLVIDLSDASYIDSAGIQAILYAYQRLRVTMGCLAVIPGRSAVRELIGLVHLDMLPGIELQDDLSSALESLNNCRPQ